MLLPMKVVVLIDGGNTRVLTRQSGRTYNPEYITKIARACVTSGEELLRILYYDCAPFNGEADLPVSGTRTKFTASDGWLHDLARRDLFAVRLGVLKFRGFKAKKIPLAAATLTDSDFEPVFEQKGVDMRIGLGITVYCENTSVERNHPSHSGHGLHSGHETRAESWRSSRFGKSAEFNDCS